MISSLLPYEANGILQLNTERSLSRPLNGCSSLGVKTGLSENLKWKIRTVFCKNSFGDELKSGVNVGLSENLIWMIRKFFCKNSFGDELKDRISTFSISQTQTSNEDAKCNNYKIMVIHLCMENSIKQEMNRPTFHKMFHQSEIWKAGCSISTKTNAEMKWTNGLAV